MGDKEYIDPVAVPPVLITYIYVKQLIGCLLIFGIFHFFWGRYMLTSFGELMEPGFVLEGLGRVWFIFAWGLGTTVLAIFVLDGRAYSRESRSVLVGKGLWLSLNAGVFEEIIYRALIFLSAMVTLPFLNFITRGFFRWFYTELLVPLANWTTFHALQPQLMHPSGWVFGAAVVSAAAAFRKVHWYLGYLGWVNSWFLGMTMFWLMFNYGLVTAIVAHALYDAIIFTLLGLTAERPRRTYRLIGREGVVA